MDCVIKIKLGDVRGKVPFVCGFHRYVYQALILMHPLDHCVPFGDYKTGTKHSYRCLMPAEPVRVDMSRSVLHSYRKNC